MSLTKIMMMSIIKFKDRQGHTLQHMQRTTTHLWYIIHTKD